MIKHSLVLPALLLVTACGYRAGDYVPVLLADAAHAPDWDADLDVCHDDVSKTGGNRAEYGASLDKCMEGRGHPVDRAASAEKFAEMEKERRRKDAETSKKQSGYYKPT